MRKNMKNYILGTFALVLLLAVSCREKEPMPDDTSANIRIENGEIAFPPAGGVHTVKIYNATSVSATPDLPWCTAQVKDGSIEVTATPYTGIESRYCMVRINADEESLYVVVQQSGVYIQGFDSSNLNLKNSAMDIVRTFKTNSTFSVSTDEDWIHLQTGEGSLHISVDENTAKEYREGDIHWSIGDLDGTITVTQFDAAEAGLLGEYTWSGYNVKTKRTWSIDAELSNGEGETYILSLTSNTYKLSIPVTMDKQTLLIPIGQPIGTYTTSAGAVYKVIPLIASGTGAVMYADVINTGNYSLDFSKNEDGKWEAVGNHTAFEGLNFQFANWPNTSNYLTEKSATNGIYLQEIKLTQK